MRPIFLFAIASMLAAQSYRPGPQVVTFFSEVDDSDQPYALYLPPAYDANHKYPLVISLHDAGSNHRLNLRRVFGKGNLMGETDAEATRYFPRLPGVNYVVASPLARGTMGYQGIAEKDVYDMLADVERRFSIDEDRVYLTGISMGGGGALWLGLTHPGIWAAIAAVCPLAPEEAREFTPNALNLPVHLFHGSIDPVVPAQGSRRWQHDFLQASAPVEYTEYPTVRHNSWDTAYKDGAIFNWFAQFRRNRFPDRVRFVSDRYQYRSACWVELDGLTTGTLASIDARFIGPNQIEVRTNSLDGFTLKLDGHPRFTKDKPLLVMIDGVMLKPVRQFSFIRSLHGWQMGEYVHLPMHKRPGQEGPLLQAFSARQIYVYGTAGSPSVEQLKHRREQALQAADWSTARSKLMLSVRVISDKEVRPSDLASSDLILFGTKETNEQIAKLAGRLPLSLNVSAADYGLFYIYPAGAHYVAINSGLLWFTGGETANLGGMAFVPEKLRVLGNWRDYVLFRGSIEDVVAEGRFSTDWSLPDQDRGKMIATGAVQAMPIRAD